LRPLRTFHLCKPINPYLPLHRRAFSPTAPRAFFDDDDSGGWESHEDEAKPSPGNDDEGSRKDSDESSELGIGAAIVLGICCVGLFSIPVLFGMGCIAKRDAQAKKKAEEDEKLKLPDEEEKQWPSAE
jgi:hypothetical protein